jgi:hypothetical protein
MIVGDGKLDRRELRDRADDRHEGRDAPFYNQRGFPRAEENFLFFRS